MHKKVIYSSKDDATKHKFNKPNPKQINNRYKEFNHTIFTAGDVDQFLEKLPIINDDITNTFKYIYHKFKKGIFVYIKNNKIHTFLPFSKKNFINDWHHLLIHSNIKQIMQNLYKYDWEASHWYANNCIIRNEFPTRENDSGIPQIYHMLKQTCKNCTIKDSYFFINKRDFPLLTKNNTEAYDCIFGENTPLISHHYPSYAPILSMTSHDNFKDIPIPTWDDWTHISCLKHNKYFHKPVLNKEDITDFCMNWDNKTPVAIFRGSSTGKGVDEHTNTRMKLCSIKSDLLDAGITNWNNRPRISKRGNKLILSTFNNKNKVKADWLTPKQQSLYKYIVHVDGHSSAYRLTLELSMKSVLLIVDSDYYIWYKKQLKPYTHYIPVKNDLSDLLTQIEWCIEHDDECKIISENAYQFYQNNLQEEHVFDYLSKTINDLNIKEYKSNRQPSTIGITKRLTKHYNTEKELLEKLTQPKTIIETNKHITKYRIVSDDVFVKKETKPHEAFISIFCANNLLDNFVYSYCYTHNHLYMDNVEGITFQDWLVNNFEINQYITYLTSIVTIVDKYQTSPFKFVHYDLSPWNIILGDNITIIDYEKSYCVYKDKEYGPYKFSSIIDVLTILIKSMNTLFQTNKKYRNVSIFSEEEESVLLKLGNFMSGTKYRQEKFRNLYELKRFVGNMSKYDNLLFMEKYELEIKTPKCFLKYLKN